MDIDTLNRIAGLARLKVDQAEADQFLSDFNKVLEYVDQVKAMDTTPIADDEIYFNHKNFTRPDKVDNNLSREALSQIAPEYENGYIVVPRVIET
ncbi:Asp-tRNA(Asn)/Glu-tRNA(Gln) amidotransferase subunit GatC [Leptospira sp. GIMC2001]|uniref:Asp-tRNA(Asn)/Glu-tRNA(Gln) amidotransferase subunit GatC n=1 Tax=Leptospira sp. GIMC2001 TaxID=1513297 RepID=UPI00234B9EB4|nr:Asp-tRNA(Asn)/Glu-tRNA(Gln) amidotransferase subunit GatC [Leptospira sp. GIMC2001]WCL48008.1 Asp-tRNA(Asn)/Glu-tRNA(Gln) amidotransferase subunit GatC [Leptospira sp. GIMC2001]